VVSAYDYLQEDTGLETGYSSGNQDGQSCAGTNFDRNLPMLHLLQFPITVTAELQLLHYYTNELHMQ
jgi:hypothetical protein